MCTIVGGLENSELEVRFKVIQVNRDCFLCLRVFPAIAETAGTIFVSSTSHPLITLSVEKIKGPNYDALQVAILVELAH